MSVISAPEYQSVLDAKVYKFTVSLSNGIFLVFNLKISSLAYKSGGGTYTRWSNLPGRVKALIIYTFKLICLPLSRLSGLLVAATTTTFFKDSIPSISFSN